MSATTKADLPPNAFVGKTAEPSESELAVTLGPPAKAAWDGLLARLSAELDVSILEWRSYSVKAGWALRLKRKARTIVWLSPCDRCFQATFLLGGKAMAGARQSGLPAVAARAVEEAKRYPEGFAVRLLIKAARDLPAVMKLAVAKLEN